MKRADHVISGPTAHAGQILVTIPPAFIASHDDRGIAAFLAHRRAEAK